MVRNLQGQIIDMLDETDGGWIIQKGRVVNQVKYDEYVQKEKDKQEAAKAIIHAINNPNAPVEARNQAPAQNGKVDALEKRMDGMEGKLDQILNALKK